MLTGCQFPPLVPAPGVAENSTKQVSPTPTVTSIVSVGGEFKLITVGVVDVLINDLLAANTGKLTNKSAKRILFIFYP